MFAPTHQQSHDAVSLPYPNDFQTLAASNFIVSILNDGQIFSNGPQWLDLMDLPSTTDVSQNKYTDLSTPSLSLQQHGESFYTRQQQEDSDNTYFLCTELHP